MLSPSLFNLGMISVPESCLDNKATSLSLATFLFWICWPNLALATSAFSVSPASQAAITASTPAHDAAGSKTLLSFIRFSKIAFASR